VKVTDSAALNANYNPFIQRRLEQLSAKSDGMAKSNKRSKQNKAKQIKSKQSKSNQIQAQPIRPSMKHC